MVKWKGVKKASRKLSQLSVGIDRQTEDGMHNFASYAAEQIKSNAIFVKGYSTGHTRREISSENLPMSARIHSPSYYSGWLEWGTRYMDAQPFFYETLNVIKYDIGKFIMKR